MTIGFDAYAQFVIVYAKMMHENLQISIFRMCPNYCNEILDCHYTCILLVFSTDMYLITMI